jgi:hypothetical protein
VLRVRDNYYGVSPLHGLSPFHSLCQGRSVHVYRSLCLRDLAIMEYSWVMGHEVNLAAPVFLFSNAGWRIVRAEYIEG